ncbi:MAG: HDOD domain-containing protein [Ectothiorhodospiraceae bacterium]|nr:HDOD domain-containing protein [Ectothiorhodospiraceae bacterium]
MSNDIKERILNALIEELEQDKLVLPSLPEVALKVRDTLDDENASFKDVAKVISTDAALSAKLLQVSNSPLLRGSTHVDSVDVAVTRMGNTMVKNCVNSLIVQQMFQPTTEITDQLFRSFWEHSSEVAAISHALAGFARLKPDQAMFAGLVHDIGALPIIKRAEDMPELLNDVPLLIEVIYDLHTTMGEALMKKWDFPPEIIAVAREHENIDRDPGGAPDLVDIVIAANLQSYFGKKHPLAEVAWGKVPAFARLGLDTEISVIDMEETGESIKEIQESLRM